MALFQQRARLAIDFCQKLAFLFANGARGDRWRGQMEMPARIRRPGYADSGGIMFGGLLFAVCVVLQFHYHDSIPWYLWVAGLIGLLPSFSEPALKLKRD